MTKKEKAFIDMTIKVSVVIPMYNVEDFLRGCLDSVLEQSLSDIEVICVDDGSTDGTRSIAEEYMLLNDNVVLLTQENSGAAVARNNALDVAQGEFVAFMDPDDWYPSATVLATLYNAATSHDALICGGSLCEFVKDRGLVTQFKAARSKCVFEEEGFISYRDYQFDFNYQRFIFSRKFLQEHSIRFPNYRRYQDPPFFVRAMAVAKEFYVVPQPSYCYRVNTKTIVWTEEKLRHLAYGLRDVIRISSDYGLSELYETEVGRIARTYLNWYEDAAGNSSLQLAEAIQELANAIDEGGAEKGSVESACAAALHRLARRCYLELGQRQPLNHLDSAIEQVFRAGCCAAPNSPLVSVIVPAYNSEQYLAACLGSVTNQTYSQIEIIVVDDGCSDGSVDVAESAAAKDPRIRILHKENGGLSSARNHGLEAANGKYILFLDSDDMLDLYALDILVRESDAHNLDCLMFGAESFFESRKSYEQGRSYEVYYNRKENYSWGHPVTGQQLFTALRKNQDFKPSACLQLLKKEFLDEYGIKFIEGILHEDNAFTLSVLFWAERTALLDLPVYKRRVREESIMTGRKGVANAFGYFAAVENTTQLVKENPENVSSEEYIEALVLQCCSMLKNARGFCAGVSEEQVADFVKDIASPATKLAFQYSVVWPAFDFAIQRNRIEELKKKQRTLSQRNRKLKKISRDASKMKNSRSYKLAKGITKLYQRIVFWRS